MITRPPITVEERQTVKSINVAATVVGLLVVTALWFFAVFNRESALSYSIGYNLYGAERVLDGDVPYRDFHTLYTPAIVYLNAALFHWFGINLYNALFGVLLFKIATTLALYAGARRVMPNRWALIAASFSLVWLRPNGPFKAVPMHYGALFLSLALWFLIAAFRRGNGRGSNKAADVGISNLFLAGVMLGLLALFKHNIGAYALLGSLAVLLFDAESARLSLRHLSQTYKQFLALIAGFALPVLPVIFYMQSQRALKAMIDTLLFGPGEFLLNRLAAVPSPVAALLLFLWLAACFFAANRFKANRPLALALTIVVTLSAAGFVVAAPQYLVDSVIFYAPVVLLIVGLLGVLFARRLSLDNPRQLLAVTLFAAAAFMEAFPRFAREQAVAAMPFLALLLLLLLFLFKERLAAAAAFADGPWPYRLALLTLPLMIFLMGGRLFWQTYFDSHLRFKSTTELSIERGRGVYFPADKAREIDDTVAYLQQRVPAYGYFFPQSYAGSSYLFLADRNNPSGAQFWGGVGVREAERIATLEALRRQDVQLIVTSRKDIEAEKYAPMRDYIEQNFELTKEFGETLILEWREQWIPMKDSR